MTRKEKGPSRRVDKISRQNGVRKGNDMGKNKSASFPEKKKSWASSGFEPGILPFPEQGSSLVDRLSVCFSCVKY